MNGRHVILAIDPSTKMGLVVLSVTKGNIDCVLQEEFKTKETDMPRLAAIGNRINDLLEEHKPTRVVIEGYSYASRHNLVTMAEVGTVIRYFLWQSNYEYLEVPPASLKKFVTGKGQCKKDLMLLNVYKNWGFETDNDNIADAFGLAMYSLYNTLGYILQDGNHAKKAQNLFALNIK